MILLYKDIGKIKLPQNRKHNCGKEGNHHPNIPHTTI